MQQAALREGPQLTQAVRAPMRFRREKSSTRDIEWVFKSVSPSLSSLSLFVAGLGRVEAGREE